MKRYGRKVGVSMRIYQNIMFRDNYILHVCQIISTIVSVLKQLISLGIYVLIEKFSHFTFFILFQSAVWVGGGLWRQFFLILFFWRFHGTSEYPKAPRYSMGRWVTLGDLASGCNLPLGTQSPARGQHPVDGTMRRRPAWPSSWMPFRPQRRGSFVDSDESNFNFFLFKNSIFFRRFVQTPINNPWMRF